MHLCEDCLAELMVDAVLSLEDTPTARDLYRNKKSGRGLQSMRTRSWNAQPPNGKN